MKSATVRWSGLLCMAALLSASAGPSAQAQDAAGNLAADQQYRTAAGMHINKAYDFAAAEWAKFLKDHPRDKRAGEARHFLGVCKLQLKDYPGAIAEFQELVKADPKFEQIPLSRLYLGTAQFHAAQDRRPELFAAAEKSLADLLRLFPEGKHVPQTLYYLGESLYAQNKKREAVDVYRRFVKDHPADDSAPDAWYALGVALGELGRDDEAETAYQEFLRRFPNHPYKVDVDVRRAEMLAKKGQWEQAEKLFAAAASTPGNEDADYALLRQAGCAYERKQYAAAAALYDDLPRRFPRSEYRSTAALGSGMSAYHAGDYAGTIERLQALVNQSGELGAEAAHWSGRAILRQIGTDGDSAKAAAALAVFDAALKTSPNTKFTAQLSLDRADALYRIESRRAEALAAYKATAEAHAGNDAIAPQARYYAAATALELGRDDEARQLSERFLENHSGHALRTDVLYVLAEAQFRADRYDAAATSYDQLLAGAPNHADREKWIVQRAWSQLLAKKYDAVAQSLQPVVDRLGDGTLQAEARHVLGLSRQALGDHASAIADFKASLKLDAKRKNADATYLALADSQQAAGDAQGARSTLADLAVAFPNSESIDRAQYRLGELAYAAGDNTSAEAAYRRVIDDHPRSDLVPLARYGLAWALMGRDAAADATKVLDTLLKEKPPAELVPQARYARALAHRQTEHYDEAIADLNEFIKSKPNEAELANALFELGVCQEKSNRKDEALKTFDRVLKNHPGYAGAPKVLYQIGWIHHDAGRSAESAAAFARLAKSYPDDKFAAEALFHVGQEAYNRRDYEAAIDPYRDAREKAANAGAAELAEKASHKLGWTYFDKKDYVKALEWFRYQRQSYPNGPYAQDAAFMEGESLFKQSQFKEALAAFARVKNSKVPNAAELTALHAGQSAAQLEDWKTAEKLLDDMAEKFPDSAYLPELTYERGWVKQNLGKEEEALKLYEAVTTQTTTDIAARARFMIGELWFIRKNHAEAVRHYFMAAYNYASPEWQAQAHFGAGRCFEVLGKIEQAKKAYEEIVKNFPQAKDVALARNRLAELNK